MGNTRKSDYNSTFAVKLRGLLDARAIQMTKLASALGVKQQTVSQWANGQTTPELKHLKPLALYFDISIDELVTGIAPCNEEMHLDTGLSNLAIEKLKILRAEDSNTDGSDKHSKSDNGIVIEFLNIVIEGMASRTLSLPRLARLCMDYIVGAHKPLLEQEALKKREAEGFEILVHGDRTNMRNDNLDFMTYRLTKDFEYFIESLTKNTKVVSRAKRMYDEFNLDLPDYSDRRFGPGVFGEVSDLLNVVVADEISNRDDRNTEPTLK